MSEPLAIHLDPETLRETVLDPGAVDARLAELRAEVLGAPDEIAELLARGELVDLLRVTGQLDEALTEAQRAADRAQLEGTLPQQHLARLRLAHVHQARGEFAEATLLFTELLAAARQFGPVIEAFTHHHAGLDDFAQRHWADARDHFARAFAIRSELDLDETEASRVALAAAEKHVDDHHPQEDR